MPNMTDIYQKVDREITEKGWFLADDEGKIALMDSALKNYLSAKLTECDSTKCLHDKNKDDVTVNELVEMLGEAIPEKNHFDTLRFLTHYLLDVSAGLQGWSVLWEVDDSEEFIENPSASFNIEGKWDQITTHEKTSYVKTFEFVRDTMNQMILGKTKQAPQLTMTKKQLPKSDN